MKNEVTAPAAMPMGEVTPMVMLQIAVERGADLDKLQQLMDIKERWEQGEARKAFVAAMAEFKANPPDILKRKHVEFQTSKGITAYDHATLADVCEGAIRGLAGVGISHSWSVDQTKGVTVTCTLTHKMGHRESVSLTSMPDESGGKNSIQALASSITYLQRYTLLSATGLAARDMTDDDARAAGAPIRDKHVNAIADILNADTEENDKAQALRDYVSANLQADQSMYIDVAGELDEKGICSKAAFRGWLLIGLPKK